MRDYLTWHLAQLKVKEQLVVRKDMDINENKWDAVQHYI